MKNILIQYLWIIALFLVVILIAGCVNRPVETNKKISVYDGSMSLAIACIFSPKDCDKLQQEQEWEEVDKQLDK
jgi:hypothetical protein